MAATSLVTHFEAAQQQPRLDRFDPIIVDELGYTHEGLLKGTY